LARKRDAIAAHLSQLTIDGDTVVHSGGQRHSIATVEAFERVRFTQSAANGEVALGLATTVIAGLVAAATGAAVGALGTVNHQFGIILGDEPVTIGAAASLLLVAALLVGLRLVSHSRG